MGQEKRQWAVGDLMTKGSKAVCGGVDTEEVSLHIRERCDCALASGSASRGPTSWTTPGCMARPSECCFLAL